MIPVFYQSPVTDFKYFLLWFLKKKLKVDYSFSQTTENELVDWLTPRYLPEDKIDIQV